MSEVAHANYKIGQVLQENGDYEAANARFRAAADRGHHRAMLELGVNTENGEGTEPNMSIANEWYRRVHQVHRNSESLTWWDAHLRQPWYHPDIRSDASVERLLSESQMGDFVVWPAEMPNDLMLSFKTLFDDVRHVKVSFDAATEQWQLQFQNHEFTELIAELQDSGFLRKPNYGGGMMKQARDEVTGAFASLQIKLRALQSHRKEISFAIDCLRAADHIVTTFRGESRDGLYEARTLVTASGMCRPENQTIERDSEGESGDVESVHKSLEDCVENVSSLCGKTDNAMAKLKAALANVGDCATDDEEKDNTDIGALMDDVVVARHDELASYSCVGRVANNFAKLIRKMK